MTTTNADDVIPPGVPRDQAPAQMTPDELVAAALAGVRSANPGTEIWLGGNKITGDRWIYRASTKAEARSYRKMFREEKERGELGDTDRALVFLVNQCVLWPDKDALADMLAKRSMLLSVVFDGVAAVSGFTEDAIQKKL